MKLFLCLYEDSSRLLFPIKRSRIARLLFPFRPLSCRVVRVRNLFGFRFVRISIFRERLENGGGGREGREWGGGRGD